MHLGSWIRTRGYLQQSLKISKFEACPNSLSSLRRRRHVFALGAFQGHSFLICFVFPIFSWLGNERRKALKTKCVTNATVGLTSRTLHVKFLENRKRGSSPPQSFRPLQIANLLPTKCGFFGGMSNAFHVTGLRESC